MTTADGIVRRGLILAKPVAIGTRLAEMARRKREAKDTSCLTTIAIGSFCALIFDLDKDSDRSLFDFY